MEELAAAGDERAKAFLASVDGKQTPATRLLGAIAAVDPDKVERQERRNLDQVKRRLMALRGEACQVCETEMPAKSLIHAHHILPVVEGGTDEDKNIVLLCPNCHAIAHWRYRKAGAAPRTMLDFFALMTGEQTATDAAA